ncbi:MAG: hypothetical protein KAW92_01065 [Candidatus Cloacimonetes bacterium]|nr:hypothetical protein [Candidatus Cloacimonadota bacterium]
MISNEQVKRAIFENELPTKRIKPFKKLKWFITLRIVDGNFPRTLKESVKLLTSALFIPNKSKKEKEIFLKSLNLFVVDMILKEYIEFYSEWAKDLSTLVEDIVKNDVQSKYLWEVSKHIGIDKVLHTSEYNNAQMLWIFYNALEEKKNKNEYTNKAVENIFEMLKPWLDKELYVHLKDTEESKRENILFEKQTKEYLEESGEEDSLEIDHI